MAQLEYTNPTGAGIVGIDSLTGTKGEVQTVALGTTSGGVTTYITPAQDGADGTGITVPAGGAGIRGWLSGIFRQLSGSATLPVCGTLAATITAAAIAASQVCTEVVVQADPANTTNVLIGNAATQAIVLQPGQAITIPAANINLIYAKMASSTGNVNYLARS